MRVAPDTAAPAGVVPATPHDESASDGRCRNCGSVAVGRFCPACGQATALHPPTVREFLHEFLGHHLAIEGSLWRTLAALLLHPGRLTADYFAGRRARYIAPLRLYLTFSLILFAVSGWSGGNLRFGNEAVQFRLPAGAAKEAAAGHVVIGPRAARTKDTGIPFVDDRIAHVEGMTDAERNERLGAGMRAYLPYVLIVLVPVLALYLKLFYWKRHRLYGEHLVVAFHAQTAAFIFAVVSAIPLGEWFGTAVGVVVAVQGFIALRRVYGGRVWPTLVREALLFAFYGLTVAIALAVTATLAIVL